MNVPINAKRLRAMLPDVVKRVRKGTRFTVIYRSRPAFQIVPVNDAGAALVSLKDDPLYRADAVGTSADGGTSTDHDAILYPRCTSIAVKRELKLTTVITTDRHFQQVGFETTPAARTRRPRKPRR